MGGDSHWSSSDEESMIFQNHNFVTPSSSRLDFEQRRTQQVYRHVLRSYQQLQIRCQGSHLEDARNKILSYTPGAWIEKSGDEKLMEYDIPKMTTLILIGPKGSGKSTLVNRISKVFESCKFAPDRAQVSYMASHCDGTYFLQEYTVPRNSASFCLYDTRSLSDCDSDNDVMIKRWLEKGVRHGEAIIRKTDDSNLKRRLQHSARHAACNSSKNRKVNFVIFVVNGVSVLKARESGVGGLDQQYSKLVATAFGNPYLSFRDDKPVVFFTHGDLLSLEDRVRVCIYLGELLRVPPATQVFDISETDDAATDLAITDMLRYSLEHADKNFPHKVLTVQNRVKIQAIIFMCVFLLIAIGVGVVRKRSHHGFKYHDPKPDLHINWHEIKYLWSD